MDEETEAGSPTPIATVAARGWPVLMKCGIFVFFLAIAIYLLTLLLPSELPSDLASKYPAMPELLEFDQQYKSIKSLIELRALMVWGASYLLPGGFFMWLAGCIVHAIENLHEQ